MNYNAYNTNKLDDNIEYVVVGAGPAAICAIAKLYHAGIPGSKIIWVDPQFKVGDFGSKLSKGSSVPGNTTVESYQNVNHAIYSMISECIPDEHIHFELASLSPESTCSLKIAAEPLQQISNHLCRLVHSIHGIVPIVREKPNGLCVEIKQSNGMMRYVLSKRVILAIGAAPKTLLLPYQVKTIPPEIAFIESELLHYLKINPGITNVAVIGSSHSAALANMHLLKAGIQVTQFMNKEYLFATPSITADGITYTQFDNTGLKGEVAKFTRQLLNEHGAKKGRYVNRWTYYIGKNSDELLKSHLSGCTHAVACIGYTPTPSIQINGLPLSQFKHDKRTTQIMTLNEEVISGLFGIGIAFPIEVESPSGERESAVGVGKFWAHINEHILAQWENHPAQSAMLELIKL